MLGLKADMDGSFTLFPLVIRDPNMVYIFPLYQPFITPILHHSNTPATINLRIFIEITSYLHMIYGIVRLNIYGIARAAQALAPRVALSFLLKCDSIPKIINLTMP